MQQRFATDERSFQVLHHRGYLIVKRMVHIKPSSFKISKSAYALTSACVTLMFLKDANYSLFKLSTIRGIYEFFRKSIF